MIRPEYVRYVFRKEDRQPLVLMHFPQLERRYKYVMEMWLAGAGKDAIEMEKARIIENVAELLASKSLGELDRAATQQAFAGADLMGPVPF